MIVVEIFKKLHLLTLNNLKYVFAKKQLVKIKNKTLKATNY